jgi:hypothetical protein
MLRPCELHMPAQFESRESHSCSEGRACESRSRRNSWVVLRTCFAVFERPKMEVGNQRDGAAAFL